uniref:Uncharacterized protein n=1 Tax=Romanomermis culicivorax TaxID=13658 RepID=A0A915IGZ5_ROMCU
MPNGANFTRLKNLTWHSLAKNCKSSRKTDCFQGQNLTKLLAVNTVSNKPAVNDAQLRLPEMKKPRRRHDERRRSDAEHDAAKTPPPSANAGRFVVVEDADLYDSLRCGCTTKTVVVDDFLVDGGLRRTTTIPPASAPPLLLLPLGDAASLTITSSCNFIRSTAAKFSAKSRLLSILQNLTKNSENNE